MRLNGSGYTYNLSTKTFTPGVDFTVVWSWGTRTGTVMEGLSFGPTTGYGQNQARSARAGRSAGPRFKSTQHV